MHHKNRNRESGIRMNGMGTRVNENENEMETQGVGWV